jgi:DNA-binding HxlR family transcriptional regulator
MALFDLLGRNWSMGIVWILSDGPLNFRELQAQCETVSPTTLNIRIKELTEALLIERCESGYRVTNLGMELFNLMKPVGRFAKKWGTKLNNETNS